MTTLKAAALSGISTAQRQSREARLPKCLFALLTVLGATSGTAAIVLPFTFGVSPLDALHLELYRFLVPAFLTPPAIAAVSVRWLRAGSLNRTERGVALFLGAVAALSTLVFLVQAASQTLPETSQEWASLLIPGLVLVTAVWFLATSRVTADLSGILLMEAAYATSDTFCLVGFAGDWQSGAWLALATLLIYPMQIACAAAVVHASSSSPTRCIK